MFSYEKLVAAIEGLETNGIISFEEFKKLPYYEIKKQYFSVPNPTMMDKTIIMIADKRSGKNGPSEYTRGTQYIEDGKVVKIVKRTDYF